MRMKLLLLLATTLLFYTQATEEKKCSKEYVVMDNAGTFSASQKACRNLEGELASEDLIDSENAEKAQSAINTFRQISTNNQNSNIWVGITVDDINQPSDKNANYFAFSDGSVFDDTNFVFKWYVVMGTDQPDYSNTDRRCSVINKVKNDEKMGVSYCGGGASGYGLCTYKKCEDENLANSEPERSRANLPVFALFMACRVFKTF